VEQEELILPAEEKGGEGDDQPGDGLGLGASVGHDKRVRAKGRAGSHNPSGRWVTPKAKATAGHNSADWACAEHLGKEWARPIGAVAVTRYRKASMAACFPAGGPFLPSLSGNL
jgi:hypothetical protein